jgi:DinB family protein
MGTDLAGQVAGQLGSYWQAHLWPRLAGLSDEEYLWQPVDGCWTVRTKPDGKLGLDGAGETRPPPLTTIAWRLVHIGAQCLANRASAFFGADGFGAVELPDDVDMFDDRFLPAQLPGTAAAALEFLQQHYLRWYEGVAGLDDEAMRAPLGPRGGPFADDPMAGLVLHISREVMHHGGEICLLRDLYAATGATSRDSRIVAR